MKLKTRLLLTLGLFFAICILALRMVYLTTREVELLNADNEAAFRQTMLISELRSAVRNEILHGYEVASTGGSARKDFDRARSDVNRTFQEVEGLLSGSAQDRGDRAVVSGLLSSYQALDAELVGHLTQFPELRGAVDQKFYGGFMVSFAKWLEVKQAARVEATHRLEEGVTHLRWRLPCAFGLTLVVLGILFFKAYRSLTGKVAELAQAIAGVAKGDLKVRAVGSTGDELGALAAQFNQMVVELATAREELVRWQDELIRVSKLSALGEMAGAIAHEVNNPLAIIHGKAIQLRRQLDAGQAANELGPGLDKIREVTERTSKIINGLRAFIRPGDEDPFQEVPVRQVLEQVLNFCSERLKAHRIELQVEPIPALSVECRPVQIEQVILNCLNNAVDAVRELPNRWIRIRVLEEGDCVLLQISDSGRGIDPKIVENLGRPFFTTKPAGEGTGLGLSVSKRILEAHHGSLSVDASAPNTTFVIRIPRRQCRGS